MMRLDRFLAEMGAGTRKEVKKLIAGGSVSVNGSPEKRHDTHIDPEGDRVELNGVELHYTKYEYYMLHKPQGIISASRADLRSRDERCVVDLIDSSRKRELFPVGRLDKDTEGLLLITNDGKLAHELLSPKKHVDKTYYAELDRELSPDGALRLEAGVDIGDERPTLPCSLRLLEPCRILITIREGRYHQIKRMLLTEGCTVTYLKRLSMGPLELDESLKKGEYRPLSEHELSLLKDPMSGSSAHIQQ